MDRIFDKVSINKRELVIGIILVLLGILMPSFFNVENLGIYDDLQKSLDLWECQYVTIAAFKLVLLNGIRCFPHYLGAFIIGDSISIYRSDKEIKLAKTLTICSLIPMVYLVIERIYHIKYDFGIPALLVITLLVILEKINFSMISFSKKILMVTTTVITFQWLDVMPYLSGYALGRGETSNDIKSFAILLEGELFLQYLSLAFFILFLFTTILLFKLIMDENNLRLLSGENRRNQRILMESNMRVMENRTYMELNHLVHDLKSPLTSVQALVGVIKLGNKDVKKATYLDKIESSIERMSSMISEILYEKQKSSITTYEMFNLILSQISPTEYAEFVQIKNNAPNLEIIVNKIRFSRAIINLLENAYYALNPEHGKIIISIDEKKDGNKLYACIIVQDNGSGISSEGMENIWESGYSTRDSLGLGLGFVKKVIDSNDSIIKIDSIEGKGTTVMIYVPAEYDRSSVLCNP
ncbi:MAG: HAMP domain-containing sensor histidine kinase [Tissierellaceae bacterium]|nr:HAMP domain-containing sensor histidine kinase [Tissierellaceae bacterium]